MKIIFLFCAAMLAGAVGAQTLPPVRVVEANTVQSSSDPAVHITLPKQVRYVGADRWVLYDVADCELHLFVEADELKNVKRFYWIQFEAYIPSKPHLKYEPSTKETVEIAGLTFYTRARFGPTAEVPKPDSDFARVMQLLNKNNYRLPAEMMNARFIHYLDKDMRKELMIIVSEDLAPSGYTQAQLIENGAIAPAWKKIGDNLIQDAKERISLRKLAKP